MENSYSLALREKITQQQLLNWKGQAFVPFTLLRNLLLPSVVQDVLRECGIEHYQEDEAVEAVSTGGHRVFAILNAIGHEASILLFRRSSDIFLGKALDSGLPYDQQFLESILPDSYQQFYRFQWKFTSPVFRRNVHDRILPKHTILPFVKVEDVSSQGAFAQVSRVTIAGSHQEVMPDSPRDVCFLAGCDIANSPY